MFVQHPGSSKKGSVVRANRSDMLFTHKGYSGPSVLDLSHHLIRAGNLGSGSKTASSAAAAAAVMGSSKAVAAATMAAPSSQPPQSQQGSAVASAAAPSAAPASPAVPTLHVNWTGETAAVWEERLKVWARVGGQQAWRQTQVQDTGTAQLYNC